MSAPPPYSPSYQPPTNQHGNYPAPPYHQQQNQYPPPMDGNAAAVVSYPPNMVQYAPPVQHYPQQTFGVGGTYVHQPYMQNTTTVITSQPAMVQAVHMMFQEYPVALTCPSCQAQVVTAVDYQVGTFAWLLCLGMSFLGLLICMFIPFCMDSCKDAVHHCPNCNNRLGVYRRM